MPVIGHGLGELEELRGEVFGTTEQDSQLARLQFNTSGQAVQPAAVHVPDSRDGNSSSCEMLSHLLKMFTDALLAIPFTRAVIRDDDAFQFSDQCESFNSDRVSDPDGPQIANEVTAAGLPDPKEFSDGVSVQKRSRQAFQFFQNFIKSMKPRWLGGHDN